MCEKETWPAVSDDANVPCMSRTAESIRGRDSIQSTGTSSDTGTTESDTTGSRSAGTDTNDKIK